MFMASLLGGFLGILFLIPFRRYFVKDMHGEFPFPEATASTEVLMAGEAGGGAGLDPAEGRGAGRRLQLPVQTFGLWRETFHDHGSSPGASSLAMRSRLEFHMLTEAAVIGLGYIVGLRYALIIACGSFLTWWVMVPMIGFLARGDRRRHLYQLTGWRTWPPGDIFFNFVRPVGIGAIAMAGMIGVWKCREHHRGRLQAGRRRDGGGQKADAGAGRAHPARPAHEPGSPALTVLTLLAGLRVLLVRRDPQADLGHRGPGHRRRSSPSCSPPWPRGPSPSSAPTRFRA